MKFGEKARFNYGGKARYIILWESTIELWLEGLNSKGTKSTFRGGSFCHCCISQFRGGCVARAASDQCTYRNGCIAATDSVICLQRRLVATNATITSL